MLHTFHRASACIIGAYAVIHIFNHLLAIQSVEAHIAFMDAFRHIYRLPVVEFVLLGCVAFQVISGVYFIKSRWGATTRLLCTLTSYFGWLLGLFPAGSSWGSVVR